jgi:hypothetical protein
VNLNLNRDQIAHLEEEADDGSKASHAYHGYFKKYYDRKCEELYARFLSAEHDQEAMQIRGTLTALNELNEDLLQKIETGILARKQLGD